MSTHVEAEVKYQVSGFEYTHFPTLITNLGFLDAGVVTQEDRYVTYEPSPLGGFDFERIRKTVASDEQIQYSWDRKYSAKDGADKKVRLEDSRVTTQQEYDQALALASVECPVVHKQRHNFTGALSDWPATISLDLVNFGGEDEYFIEAEILTDTEHGREARKLCKQWLAESLGVNTLQEAPGYLKQYFASIQA